MNESLRLSTALVLVPLTVFQSPHLTVSSSHSLTVSQSQNFPSPFACLACLAVKNLLFSPLRSCAPSGLKNSGSQCLENMKTSRKPSPTLRIQLQIRTANACRSPGAPRLPAPLLVSSSLPDTLSRVV